MKTMLILMLITSCLGLCGCAPAQHHLAHFRQDVERSNKTAETIFDYPYKDVFMAIVQVCNDTVTTIYTKDFDTGIILGKNDLGNALGDFQKPSHNFGFWLKDLGNNKTKVTLRMVEPQWPMGGTAEDEFNLIKKELEIRAKLKDGKNPIPGH
ncbi:MAG: hypothetical protein WC330_04950 [Candidatus Omnitrophota bacterium]|jgi:hypothetical protein